MIFTGQAQYKCVLGIKCPQWSSAGPPLGILRLRPCIPVKITDQNSLQLKGVQYFAVTLHRNKSFPYVARKSMPTSCCPFFSEIFGLDIRPQTKDGRIFLSPCSMFYLRTMCDACLRDSRRETRRRAILNTIYRLLMHRCIESRIVQIN